MYIVPSIFCQCFLGELEVEIWEMALRVQKERIQVSIVLG